MNPHNPQGASPGTAQADVSVSKPATTKVTVKTSEGAAAKGYAWPSNTEEWKRWIRSAIPWAAGAAILIAAISMANKNRKSESVVDSTKRKAKRAADKTESAVGEAKERADRGWFNIKRAAEIKSERAGDAADKAKSAVTRKVEDAGERASDIKEGAKEWGQWAGNKAHSTADAAKSAYRTAANTTSHAAHNVEERVAAAGNAALANASAVEEKTGSVMKDVGETLQKDGRTAKQHFRAEEATSEQKKKWGCSIM